jgi:putative ABC transport system permease protein
VLAGRDFGQHDLSDHQNVMLISQAGGRKGFGSENPIGKILLTTSGSVPTEIIGIVGDVRSERVAQKNEMEFYRPWTQENFPFLILTVASKLPAPEITRQTQRALNSIDPALAIAQPQMMTAIVAQALGQARLTTILLGVFAAVALLLATVGIYGAVAYSVEQRTGEIGVRMALGAQTSDVLRLIIGQGMKPVFFGLIIGLAAALALGRLIATQLYEVSAHNPVLLGSTAAVLATAALLACLFPARRASRVNPMVALRTE